jgi:hypothetical protein
VIVAITLPSAEYPAAFAGCLLSKSTNYRSRDVSKEYTYELPSDETTLALGVFAMRSAWIKTLTRYAVVFDNHPGPWLDDLEHEIVNEIKSTSSDGLTIEREAAVVAPILKLATDVFAQARDAMEAYHRDRGQDT